MWYLILSIPDICLLPYFDHFQWVEPHHSNVYSYLIFVGYSSGVVKKIVLNDPVIAILPMRVNTVEVIIIPWFPAEREN